MSHANVKLKVQSDSLIFDLEMYKVLSVPQIFYVKKKTLLSILIAKIVDHMLIAGKMLAANQFLHAFIPQAKFGTPVNEPGKQRFSWTQYYTE